MDLAAELRADGYDLAFAEGIDFSTTDGLDSAVLLSLQVEQGNWFGDTLRDDGGKIGCDRKKVAFGTKTPTALSEAVAEAKTALAWIVEGGYAQSVDVTGEWIEGHEGPQLALYIEFETADGRISLKYLSRS